MDWTPTPEEISQSNVAWLMQQAGVETYADLHAWSVNNFETYWATAIERLGIHFSKPLTRIVDLSQGKTQPVWLPDVHMNIVESCFSAPPESTAIVFQAQGGEMESVTVAELKTLTGRVAAGIQQQGFQPGDAIAMLMPMTVECVAIYLGIIQAGCVAVSLADSFQPKEIRTRLHLSNAAGIFTQDVIRRGPKTHPLFSGVVEADAPRAIVISADGNVDLREGDVLWTDFLAREPFTSSVQCSSTDPVNILFSSGTTGDPKVIPWTQTTPIKCAADAHFHQDVHPGDVLVWPTNIGWMMGPWLIFASLLNRAAIGLYDGAPTGEEFCRFVQNSGATLLGLVPSLVKAWKNAGATKGLDWSQLRAFSSTGECSNAGDMRWLMAQAGNKPVIEYCGGTEIGGAYITGTPVLPASAGTFNTPALGLDFVILNEQHEISPVGEIYLMTPSLGLSTTLLNKDHFKEYFAGTPPGPNGEILRKHGDQMQALPNGFWRAQGRADDTMNLGGIKVSSAEIERLLLQVPGIKETAAVAHAPEGGPSLLVVFTVRKADDNSAAEEMEKAMQQVIKTQLNPLFKIHDVVWVPELPRTASNKVMHRKLRDQYQANI